MDLIVQFEQYQRTFVGLLFLIWGFAVLLQGRTNLEYTQHLITGWTARVAGLIAGAIGIYLLTTK